jgi:uncharacterized protein YbbC (DUF1343 family)
VEGANVSVGRGTDTPFEIVGAPWIDGRNLATVLNDKKIQGVRFLPTDFKPSAAIFAGEVCHGVQIVLIDRQAFEPTEMGVELLSAFWRLAPQTFALDKTLHSLGSQKALESIRSGESPSRIWYDWQEPLEKFKKLRAQYLLYP